MPSLAQTARMRSIAAAMSVATIVVAVLLVGAGIYIAFDLSAMAGALRAAGVVLTEPAGATVRVIIVALGLPALGLILWSLWNAFWLFRAYRAGDIVTVGIGRSIRRMGIALLAFPFATTVTNLLSTMVISWNNPEGQRQVVLSVSSESMIMAITGAILVMVGWSMVEAARIVDENRQFV